MKRIKFIWLAALWFLSSVIPCATADNLKAIVDLSKHTVTVPVGAKLPKHFQVTVPKLGKLGFWVRAQPFKIQYSSASAFSRFPQSDGHGSAATDSTCSTLTITLYVYADAQQECGDCYMTNVITDVVDCGDPFSETISSSVTSYPDASEVESGVESSDSFFSCHDGAQNAGWCYCGTADLRHQVSTISTDVQVLTYAEWPLPGKGDVTSAFVSIIIGLDNVHTN